MRQVRERNTNPEMVIRSLLRSLGVKFKLHRKDLPGRPDITFLSHKKAIFVNGCFWHGHTCARGCRVPKSNRTYWVAKVAKNRARDIRNRRLLRVMGWKSLVIWECQLRRLETVKRQIMKFLRRADNRT